MSRATDMTDPASPPVAVGVELADRYSETRAPDKEDIAWLQRVFLFEIGNGHCGESTSDMIDRQRARARSRRIMNALASPVRDDGSSADADTHRSADRAVLDWKDVADSLCAGMLKQAPAQARKVAETLYETLLETVQDYLRDNVDYNLSADLSRARRKESEANIALQNIADALKVETRGFPNYPTPQMVEGLCLAAIKKLAQPAASRPPCMETLQASECTKHGEGDQ